MSRDQVDGMAVRDVFELTTVGWVDEDTPLSYRFGSKGDMGRVSWLSDYAGNWSAKN